MKLKYVMVPLTQHAMNERNFGNFIEDEIEEIVLSDEAYSFLAEWGLFDELNHACNVWIGDFEDATIIYDNLEIALEIVEKYTYYTFAQSEEVTAILELIKLAIKCHTCVDFYF